MPWGELYPSQWLFLPCHSSTKTCWETTTLVEMVKNQYSLNSSSFPHLFKQCSSLFSPAWFNPYINYIIFLSVHLVTILWLKQSSKEKLCYSFAPTCKNKRRFLMASQGCSKPVHILWLFLSSERSPSSGHFLELRLSIFSSKEDPLWQLLNYVLKLLITPEQHMPKAYTGVLILN